MAYPGDATLDPAVQQRILTAFKEAARLYRDGHGEEARTILRSITDVDPRFTPAQRLEQAIAAGAPVDLGQLIGEVTAQGGVDAAGTMAKANQAFAGRDFQGALTLAQSVLRDMPGHAQARQLAFEAQNRLRAAGEIQTHLGRVRQALDAGLAEDARGFLQVAKTLDPGHPDLALLEQRQIGMAGVERLRDLEKTPGVLGEAGVEGLPDPAQVGLDLARGPQPVLRFERQLAGLGVAWHVPQHGLRQRQRPLEVAAGERLVRLGHRSRGVHAALGGDLPDQLAEVHRRTGGDRLLEALGRGEPRVDIGDRPQDGARLLAVPVAVQADRLFEGGEDALLDGRIEGRVAWVRHSFMLPPGRGTVNASADRERAACGRGGNARGPAPARRATCCRRTPPPPARGTGARTARAPP